MIFSKGSDQLIVKYEGNVLPRPRWKEGQPKTTMKGSYAIVSATGELAGTQGEGNNSGYFAAKTRYRIDWEGTRRVQKGAMVSPARSLTSDDGENEPKSPSSSSWS